MKILVTGSAGFIGAALTLRLLARDDTVIGLDNHNNYYDPASSTAPWRVYNIGNSQPVQLMDYIAAFEEALGKTAEKEMLPLQPGDMPDTYADVADLKQQFDYKPDTPVKEGVRRFVEWYRQYYSC